MIDKSEFLQTLTTLELSNLIAFTIQPNTSARTLDKLQLDIAAIRKEQHQFFKLLELDQFYREIVFRKRYQDSYATHMHGWIYSDFTIEELIHYSQNRPFKYFFTPSPTPQNYLAYIDDHKTDYPNELFKSRKPQLIINKFQHS